MKHTATYRARRQRMRRARKDRARLELIGYAGWLEQHRAADPHCTCNDCIQYEIDQASRDHD